MSHSRWSDGGPGESDRSDRYDKSDRRPLRSDRSDNPNPLFPKHGGYRCLRSFQTAELIFDATVVFCRRFVPGQSRTRDQMVQAARSGRQNIAEGSIASATSKKSELKLTNVAKASLEELLLDYEDFLRQRSLRQWDKNSPQALLVRKRFGPAASVQTHGIDRASPEVAANTLTCLIHQATFLLRRQLRRLETEFLKQGGFTERLHRSRSEYRSRKSRAPRCSDCGAPMVLRIAKRGPNAGRSFWGCSAYPRCTGVRQAEERGGAG